MSLVYLKLNFQAGVATESTMPYQRLTGGEALVLNGLIRISLTWQHPSQSGREVLRLELGKV